jgi:hypothetical protein
VTQSDNEKQVKDAIDWIFAMVDPTYMTIFGAPDVVPHQLLNNPVSDRDPDVPSDLPYASASPFSRNVSNFLAPSRVVSRLPDLHGMPDTGGKDPEYPLRVLAKAADRTTGTVDDYRDYFAVSAEVWNESTTTSVTKIFGNASALTLSPPNGPTWSPNQMSSKSFFVNAHGDDRSSTFSGQKSSSYPTCLSSAFIRGTLSTNMVFAVEACYGAQLYDPLFASDQVMGIVNQSVGDGCCGYFGSSNIAYGPPAGQGQADIITQLFLKSVLAGKTVGQAALDARQTFIGTQGMTNPTNLKTIGQFMLMADASFAPVILPTTTYSLLLAREGAIVSTENERRAIELQLATDHSEPAPEDPIPGFVSEAITRIATEQKLTNYSVTPHRVVFNESHAHLYAELDMHVYEVLEEFERPGLTTPGYKSIEITATRDEIIAIEETFSK